MSRGSRVGRPSAVDGIFDGVEALTFDCYGTIIDVARRFGKELGVPVGEEAAARFADSDEVVTAQQVGSYKPDLAHFEEVLGRLGLPKERVLHVAQSLYHDIAPARTLGLTCVWVDRRDGRPGGATPPTRAIPDRTVPDLATLARAAHT